MAELSLEAQSTALEAVIPDDAVIALTRGGEEIDDPGYAPVPLNPSRPVRMERFAVITNSDALTFGPWESDAPSVPDGFEIRDAQGQWLIRGTLHDVTSPRRGQNIVIHPRRLAIGV